MIRCIFLITQFYGIPALKQAYFLKPPMSGFLEPMAQKIPMIPYIQHVTFGPLINLSDQFIRNNLDHRWLDKI